MKLAVISPPEAIPREEVLFKLVLDKNIHAFHLRRPEWSADQLRRSCDAFTAAQRSKIVLHSCHELVEEYGLKVRIPMYLPKLSCLCLMDIQCMS